MVKFYSALIRWALRAPFSDSLKATYRTRLTQAPFQLRRSQVIPVADFSHRAIRYVSSTSSCRYPAVELASNGRKLIIKDSEREDASYHPTCLRHNCQCPSCTASSGQKTINPSELTPSLTVDSAVLSDNQLELSWSSGHHGYVHFDWLRERGSMIQDRGDSSTPKVASELPVMSAVGLLKDKEKQWKWLHYLNEYGMCLLTDLGTEKGELVKLGQTMYNVQDTIYGETFDVVAKEDFINIAYSTNYLGFHMDLVYYESPPGLQLLHCLRFDQCVEGGESVLLDMFPVVGELRDKSPEHFNTLTRVPATFQKIHYDREEPVEMVCQCPHIELDSRGEVVSMTWSPPFEGPLSIPEDDIEPYYEAYNCLARMLEDSKLKVYHRLQPGEVLTFNNRRALHSRNEFKLNGGERHLQGIYVNIDHFKSVFQVLCKQLGKDIPVRRVFDKR